MQLRDNVVLEWKGGGKERVLRLSPDGTEWITIRVDTTRMVIKRYQPDELEAALDRDLVEILKDDPKTAPFSNMPDDRIPETFRNVRDRRWSQLERILKDPGILDATSRPHLIKTVIDPERSETSMSRGMVYSLVTRFFQCGQSCNALLPDYDRCGGRGKPRVNPRNDHKRLPGTSQTLDSTQEIREIFERWLSEKYDKKTKPSLFGIFLEMSGIHWSCGYELNKDGKRVPKLLPQEQRPTYDQFKYYFARYHDPEKSAEQRLGAIMAARSTRVRDMDTRHLAFGPNSLWMADGMESGVNVREGDEEHVDLFPSTPKTKLFILDEDNPLVVLGPAKVIGIGDVYTHAIVMVHATLEEESYDSIRSALELAMCDKVEYCAQYGLTIGEHEWPFHHLPDKVLTDRGPLRGKMGDHLSKSFDIDVETTAPYRPDLKGFIERTFRSIRDNLLHSLPGAAKGRRAPGEKDPRLNTALTLKELNSLLIAHTLHHNNYRRLRNYPITPEMRRDGVEPYPIQLWRWGAQKRSGRMRIFPHELIRRKLLPTATASITEQGLYFEKLYFGCQAAFFHAMRFRAKHKGSRSIEIAYDPRLVDVVYLIRDSGREFIPCEIKGSSDRFKGRTWPEVKALLKEERQGTTHARTRDDQGALACQSLTSSIVKRAVARASKLRRPQTNRGYVEHIRDNRDRAKTRNRVAAARRANGQSGAAHIHGQQQPTVERNAASLTTRRKRLVHTFNRVLKGGRHGRV